MTKLSLRKKLYSTRTPADRKKAFRRAERTLYRLQQFETCYDFSPKEFLEWYTAWKAVKQLTTLLKNKPEELT